LLGGIGPTLLFGKLSKKTSSPKNLEDLRKARLKFFETKVLNAAE